MKVRLVSVEEEWLLSKKKTKCIPMKEESRNLYEKDRTYITASSLSNYMKNI